MKQFISAIIFSLFAVFVQNAQSQNTSFPNELMDYKFFGEGKLKDLKLGISEKADVIKIFGENCEQSCNYDDSWNIKFHYFNNWTQTKYKNETKQTFISSPEFTGKVWIVEIFPKKIISFSEMPFSKIFKPTPQGVIVGKGFKSALKDSNNLSYLFENENTISGSAKLGNLLAIRYDVSEEIDKKAWILSQVEDLVQK